MWPSWSGKSRKVTWKTSRAGCRQESPIRATSRWPNWIPTTSTRSTSIPNSSLAGPSCNCSGLPVNWKNGPFHRHNRPLAAAPRSAPNFKNLQYFRDHSTGVRIVSTTMPLKTLFLNPPSFENYDGGASSRWPATREIESYWYPVWLAYPAGMLEGSRMLDAPPHHVSAEETIEIAKGFDFLVLFTSTVGWEGDQRLAEAVKRANPAIKIAFVGPHVTVL